VNTTIVDGKVLMRDRQLMTMDEASVLAEANKALVRVVRQIGW
jgi:hypothetical protein